MFVGTTEHETLKKRLPVTRFFSGSASTGKVKVRATHEIMAARTTQLAFLVDQFMPAAQAKPPMLAGNVFVRQRRTSFRRVLISLVDVCS